MNNRITLIVAACATFIGTAKAASAEASVVVAPVSPAAGLPMKIVQIDLARQMETLSNLSNYVGRVKSLGYDTLQLYVEGRIGTKSFSLPIRRRRSRPLPCR